MGDLVAIDFRSKNRKTASGSVKTNVDRDNVIDIKTHRKEKKMKERRRNKRIILTEYFSAYVQVPTKGLQEVTLYDISKKGIAFNIAQENGCFNPKEIINIRIYLNGYTYYRFTTKVSHIQHLTDEGVYRVGAEFLINKWNRYPLNSFVEFVKSMNSEIKIDVGDMVINYR